MNQPYYNYIPQKLPVIPLRLVKPQKALEVSRQLIGPPAWTWKAFQLEWVKNAAKKELVGVMLYTLLFLVLITLQNVPNGGAELKRASPGAITLSALDAFLSVALVYINLFHQTPPGMEDIQFKLVARNYGGRFSYLTLNILVFHAIFHPITFFAQLLTLSNPSYQTESNFATKMLLFSHTTAVLSATFSLVVGILFLKLVYFEPTWRHTVLANLIKRGHIYTGEKALIMHLLQTPISFFDLVFVKDSALLKVLSPRFSVLVGICFVIGVAFFGLTKLNWCATGGKVNNVSVGLVPYPFLSKFMGRIQDEVKVFSAISMFVAVCSSVVHVFVHSVLP